VCLGIHLDEQRLPLVFLVFLVFLVLQLQPFLWRRRNATRVK
jgi:hypothetical protein